MSDIFSPNMKNRSHSAIEQSYDNQLSPNSETSKQSAALSLAILFNSGGAISHDSPPTRSKPISLGVDVLSCNDERGGLRVNTKRKSSFIAENSDVNEPLMPVNLFSTASTFLRNGDVTCDAVAEGQPRDLSSCHQQIFYYRKRLKGNPCIPDETVSFSTNQTGNEKDQSLETKDTKKDISFQSSDSSPTHHQVARILATELPSLAEVSENNPLRHFSSGPSTKGSTPPLATKKCDGLHRINMIMQANNAISPPPGHLIDTPRYLTEPKTPPFDDLQHAATSQQLTSTLTTTVPATPGGFSNAADTSVSSGNTTSYTRKEKSLGMLSRNFLDLYSNTDDSNGPINKETVINICEVADKLRVERRRIYDIINIMESVEIVSRVKKNTYRWHGKVGLPRFFARLQRDALRDEPNTIKCSKREDNSSEKITTKGRSMSKLCQKFIQIFLVTERTEIGLTEAAENVLGPLNIPELGENQIHTSKEKKSQSCESSVDDTVISKAPNVKAAKNVKTKIRRMYDIANVLQSIGIIQRENVGSTKNKLSFRWVYHILPCHMSQHLESDAVNSRTPGRDHKSRINTKSKQSVPVTPEETFSKHITTRESKSFCKNINENKYPMALVTSEGKEIEA